MEETTRYKRANNLLIISLCLVLLMNVFFTLTMLRLSLGQRKHYTFNNRNEKFDYQKEDVHKFCGLEKRFSSRPYTIYHNGNSGRFGNLMFSYASVLGISAFTKRKSLFNKRFEILKLYFPNLKSNLTIASSTSASKTYMSITEFGPWSFEEDRFLRNLQNQSVSLCCYLNSWRYFSCIEKHVRHQFKFGREYQKKADDFLSSIRESVHRTTNATNLTFVGVHIRMGDIFLDKKFQGAGFRVAPLYYIQTAMDYYKKKHLNVQFIVCTDNLKWTRENIGTMSRDVHLATKGLDAMEDMALLSRCNHSVMTQGTFGWWSSFLAGGEVVYYHPPVRHVGGAFNRTYKRENVYPPHWTCFTDDPDGEKLSYVRPCRASDQI